MAYAGRKAVAETLLARVHWSVKLVALGEGKGEVTVAVLRGEELAIVVGQGQRVVVLDEEVRPVDIEGIQH